MKKNKLKWRLGKLPTSEEVIELVKHKLITNEEAKEILFNLEEDEVVEKEALEAEIKFLRQLVERLSTSRTQIVETIKYVEKPYYKWEWHKPYEVWCNADNKLYGTAGITTTNAVNNLALNTSIAEGGLNTMLASVGANNLVETTSFSEIKTF